MLEQICQQYLTPIDPKKHITEHIDSVLIIADMLGPDVYKYFEPVLKAFSCHVQQLPLNARGLSYEPNSVFVQGLLTVGFALRQAKRITLYAKKPLKIRNAAVRPAMLTIACAALLSNIAEPATRLTVRAGRDQWDATRENLFDWLTQRPEQRKTVTFKEVPECGKYPDYASMILCHLLPDSVKSLLGQMPDLHLPGLLLRLVRRDFTEAAELHLPITLCIVNATRQVAEEMVYEAKCKKLQSHPPHLPVMLGMLLCTAFNDLWDMTRNADIDKKVVMAEGRVFVTWPEGFTDLAEQAKKLWPASELDFTAHGLLGCLADFHFVEYHRESDFAILPLPNQGEMQVVRLMRPERYFRKDSEWSKAFQESQRAVSGKAKRKNSSEEAVAKGKQSPMYADDYARGVLQDRTDIVAPAKPKPLTAAPHLAPFEKDVIKEKSVEIDRIRRSADQLTGAEEGDRTLDNPEGNLDQSVKALKKSTRLERLCSLHKQGVNDEVYLTGDEIKPAENTIASVQEQPSLTEPTPKAEPPSPEPATPVGEEPSSSPESLLSSRFSGLKKLWGKVGSFFAKKPVETPPSPLDLLKEEVLSPDDVRSFEVEAESVMQERNSPEPKEMPSETIAPDDRPAAATPKKEEKLSGKMVQTVKEKSPKKSTVKKVTPAPEEPGETSFVTKPVSEFLEVLPEPKKTAKTAKAAKTGKTVEPETVPSAAKPAPKKGKTTKAQKKTAEAEPAPAKAGTTERKTSAAAAKPKTVAKTAKESAEKPTSAKSTAAKKTAAKKTAVKKTTVRKTVTKKTAANEKTPSPPPVDLPFSFGSNRPRMKASEARSLAAKYLFRDGNI